MQIQIILLALTHSIHLHLLLKSILRADINVSNCRICSDPAEPPDMTQHLTCMVCREPMPRADMVTKNVTKMLTVILLQGWHDKFFLIASTMLSTMVRVPTHCTSYKFDKLKSLVVFAHSSEVQNSMVHYL